MNMLQGRPQDLAGGGANFFFSDLEICALLGGFGQLRGHAPPRIFFLNGAFWCIKLEMHVSRMRIGRRVGSFW